MNRFTLSLFVLAIAVCAQPTWWSVPSAASYGNFLKPLPVIVPEPVEAHVPTTTLTVVGDVMLARNVETLMKQYGTEYPFTGFDLTAYGGYVLGNFEGAVPEVHQQTPNFTYAFSVPTSSLPALRTAGFTHFSLANNHSYDSGLEGFQNTQTALADADMIALGDQVESATTSMTTLDLGSVTVAVLSLYAVNRVPDLATVDALLASSTATYTIAYLHWGTEYQVKPDAAQKKLAQELVNRGVDLIIGHHPHVVGTIDLIDGVPVIYSLGNYIFDQYFDESVMTGLVLTITPETDGLSITLEPVTSSETLSVPESLSRTARRRWLEALSAISAPELKTQIRAGELKL